MRPAQTRFPLATFAVCLVLWACGGDQGSVAGGSGTDAGNALEVVALEPTGAPAARAMVEVWPEDLVPTSESALPVATGTTGTDGTTRLQLPPGRWSIVVRKGGTAWRRVVAVGNTARDTLRPMASLEGEVLSGGGLLVAVQGLGRAVRCDPSGRFAFDSLPSGRHILVVRSTKGDITKAVQLAPSETALTILPSDTLRLDPRDTLETSMPTSTLPLAPPSTRLGSSGPFAAAARLRRTSTGDSATIFSWSSTGDEGLRLGWKGLDTLRLEVPGRSPIEIAGIPLDTGSHLLGIGWTSGILGIWLDAELVLSLSTQSVSDRSGWSSTFAWGSNGVTSVEGIFHKTGEVPSDWFLQLSRSP
jgi:hypothetical protein